VKTTAIAIGVCAALAAAVGCGSSDSSAETAVSERAAAVVLPSEYKGEPPITIPKGPPPKKLEIVELKEGTGAEAKKGDQVDINFVAAGYEVKKKYETTWDNNELFTLPVDQNGSVEVLDGGVEGMRVGGRRELIAPANLVYDEEAAIYIVYLMKVN